MPRMHDLPALRHGRTRVQLASGLIALLALSCGGEAAAPKPAATPVKPKSGGQKGPVVVKFHGPTGEVDKLAEIAVVFDRPMIALGQAADPSRPVLVLEPAVPGEV